jgi:sarcosine/dimethylglycine N-methyltransferase
MDMTNANTDYSAVVETARDYYNSDDADNFYFHIWGGEDIHIGLYEREDEPIFDASRRTVESMAATLSGLGPGCRVLDIGAGYGGAARYLAKTYGCRVVALNLSEKENERDRQMNREQGLDETIEVIDASFEKIPFPDESFDVVWSQDAILHSGERARVIAEAARVLKPGGEMVFTDIMQVEDVDAEALQPVLDRIHLDSLGSLSFYRDALSANGLEEVAFSDHTAQLPRHYARVLGETEARSEEIDKLVSDAYITRMKTGLRHWVDAGNKGRLQWGILHFRKPS